MTHPRSLVLGIDHLRRIRGDQLAFYAELHARHGDAVRLRLGPNRLWLFFHPREIEGVLVRHWASFERARRIMDVVRQWNGDSLLLAEGQDWRDRRRKVQPAFASRRVAAYAGAAADHATRFCDALGNGDEASFDVDAACARLTLDIACATLFGAEPLPNGDEVERAIQILSDTAFRESAAPVTLPDWLPLPAKTRKVWAMRVMDDVVTGLVRRRLEEGGGDRGDLLSMLVDQHDGDPQAIRDDAMSLLIAGHETSGALLTWLFWALIEHPWWTARIRDEADTVVGARAITAADVPKLPVLRAVVAEVLRLWPPAYSLFLRQATEPVRLDAVTIARGDLVQIVPYTIHRDPRWFADPHAFRPERFLGEATWPAHSYLPFGDGPRICIGQNFALVEACIVVATILRRWVPVSVAEAPVVEAKFSLRPRGGLVMRWARVSRA